MNPIAKRTLTALSLAALLIGIVVYAPAKWLAVVICIFGTLAVVEFAQLLSLRCSWPSAGYLVRFVPGMLILASAFGVLAAILMKEGNIWLLFIIAIVKISDMGGFAFGLASAKIMRNGNHKLCPAVSPNKSWEGLGGSVFGSCLVGWGFMPFTNFPFALATAIACTAAIVGTFGDLVESKFKRWIGVKDSSTMKFTNGMGGVLDMFDSLIFAPAAIWGIILLSR